MTKSLDEINYEDRNEMLAMVHCMRVYGGSFVAHLAECFIVADYDNLRRLFKAFPEYVEQYRKMANYEGNSCEENSNR